MYLGVFRVPGVSRSGLRKGYFEIRDYYNMTPMISYHVPRSRIFKKIKPHTVDFSLSVTYPVPEAGYLDVSVPSVFKNSYKLLMCVGGDGEIQRLGYTPVRKLNKKGKIVASGKREKHAMRFERDVTKILRSETFREGLRELADENVINPMHFSKRMGKYLGL